MFFEQGTFQVDPNLTPEELQARREMLRNTSPKYGRARYVGEGLGDLGRGILEGVAMRRMNKTESENRNRATDVFSGLFGRDSDVRPGIMGGSYAPPSKSDQMFPTGQTGPAPQPEMDRGFAMGETVDPMEPYRNAIKSIESKGSGDYAAVGPTHPELGRALGAYQIMEANIGPWSREVLGRPVTTQEFLENPQIQDAIFDAKFGGYVERFGPEGAAQAWFAGPGGVGKMNRKDSLGTSVADYTQKFNQGVGGVQVASNGRLNDLYSALQNPWLNQSQRRVVEAEIQRETQAMDPMRQMQLEKGQLEIDRLRNPQPDLTAGQREYDMARQQGYEGTFMDYKRDLAEAQRAQTNVNVNTGGGEARPELLGTSGLVAIPDPSVPEGYRVVPAPGSPLAREQEQEAAAKEQSQRTSAENEQTRSNVVSETTGRIREALTGGGVFDLPEVGVMGERLGRWGVNQEARDVGGMLDTLKGMVVFDRLEKLKQASATGASGLGQVTEREIALLGAQLGALDQSLSKDLILETLDTVDGVFGKLSPAAQDYLTGQSDSLPSGSDRPSENLERQIQSIPDFGAMTDEQLQKWIEENG